MSDKKFDVQEVFEQYAQERVHASEFLRNKAFSGEVPLTALDLALLKIIEHLGKCEVKEIMPFLNIGSGGIRVLGTCYNSTERKYAERVYHLRTVGLVEIIDRKDRKNTMQLSKGGGELLLQNFFEYMELKKKNAEAPSRWDANLYDRMRNIIEEDYKEELNRLASRYPIEKALYLDYEQIENRDLQIAEMLRIQPIKTFELFQDIIRDLDIITDITTFSESKFVPHLRIKNFPEVCKLPLASINSNRVGELVFFEGMIVGKDMTPHSMVSKARFRCNRCGNTKIEQPQDIFATQIISAVRCSECGGIDLRFIPEQSDWLDFTRMELQDNIDDLVSGNQQVRNFSLIVVDDLCNKAAVGDRVSVVGVLQLSPPQKKSNDYIRFVHVVHMEKTEEDLDVSNPTDEEKQKFQELSKDPELYPKMIASIAPSIYGHEDIKEAIMLQIFGGRKEKVNPEGLKERSDSHILLIGDPSTAKSRMMKSVSRLVPKVLWASGKGASGCGLTATVTKDETNKGRFVVKAGAMVLANGGLLCVDEFDKMEEEDRTRMHDGMELQTIHINKADVMAKMKSETTILACANPELSRFDTFKPVSKQLDLPASLLSRFDLIFILIDKPDREKDKKIAQKIIRNHTYVESIKETKKEDEAPIPQALLRKYIAYARSTVDPVLSLDAQSQLVEMYVSMRSAGGEAVHVTTRQLEGLIRLCEASAKIRLCNDVTMDDVERVVRIFTKNIRDIASDPVTGEIDIDRIMTPHSMEIRSRYKTVDLIIRQGCDENREISVTTVLRKAAEKGISDKECRELIQELKEHKIVSGAKDNVLRLID